MSPRLNPWVASYSDSQSTVVGQGSFNTDGSALYVLGLARVTRVVLADDSDRDYVSEESQNMKFERPAEVTTD